MYDCSLHRRKLVTPGLTRWPIRNSFKCTCETDIELFVKEQHLFFFARMISTCTDANIIKSIQTTFFAIIHSRRLVCDLHVQLFL